MPTNPSTDQNIDMFTAPIQPIDVTANPFDINNANLATTVDLPKLSDNFLLQNNPYKDLAIIATEKPTVDLSGTSKAPIKDTTSAFIDAMDKTANKKNDVAFSYSADKDIRYKNLDYNPTENTEKKYSDNQGSMSAWGIQFHRLWNNAYNTFKSNAIGTGRGILEAAKLEFNNDTSFNTPETVATYFDSLNDEQRNPIYNDGTPKSWYSPKGAAGDFVASQGFSVGAIGGSLLSAGIGEVLDAAYSNPITAAIATIGIGALFNDGVRNFIGQENSRMALGLLGEGAASLGLAKGLDKMTAMIPAKSINVLSNAIKTAKADKDYYSTIGRVVGSTIDKIYAKSIQDTILDTGSVLSKEIKVANTVNKVARTGVTAAKMYMSSGAEAGMEGINSQYEHIGEELEKAQKEGRTLSDTEYAKVWQEGLDMSHNVYNINRVLLGATNMLEFGDIITGNFLRNSVRDLNDVFTGRFIRHELSDIGVAVGRKGPDIEAKVLEKKGISKLTDNVVQLSQKAKNAVVEGFKSLGKKEAKALEKETVEDAVKVAAKDTVENVVADTTAKATVDATGKAATDKLETDAVEAIAGKEAVKTPEEIAIAEKATEEATKAAEKATVIIEKEALRKAGQFEARVINDPWYKLVKHLVIDSVIEGFEEGAQYTISEGNKEYLRKKNENKSQADSYMYGLNLTLTTYEGWNNIISGLLGGILNEGMTGVVRGVRSATRDNNRTSFKEGFTGFNQKMAQATADKLNKVFQATEEATVRNKEFLSIIQNETSNKSDEEKQKDFSDWRDKIDDHLYSVAVAHLKANKYDAIKEYVEDYFAKDTDSYQSLVKLYGSEENVEKAKTDLLGKMQNAEESYTQFKQFYYNPYTVNSITRGFDSFKKSALGKRLKSKENTTVQDTKEKAEMYENMVDLAAHTYFMVQNKKLEFGAKAKELIDMVDDIAFNHTIKDEHGKDVVTPIKINSLINLKPFFTNQFVDETGKENGYEMFLQEIEKQKKEAREFAEVDLPDKLVGKAAQELKIERLEALQKDVEKNHENIKIGLEALKKEGKQVTVEGITKDEPFTEDELKIIDYYASSTNPLFKYLAQKTSLNKDLFKEVSNKEAYNVTINASNYKNNLEKFADLSTSIFFLTSDLKKMTSKKDQIALIDYLYSIDKKNKKTTSDLIEEEADKKRRERLGEIPEKENESPGSIETKPVINPNIEKYKKVILDAKTINIANEVIESWLPDIAVNYTTVENGHINKGRGNLRKENGEWLIDDIDTNVILKIFDILKTGTISKKAKAEAFKIEDKTLAEWIETDPKDISDAVVDYIAAKIKVGNVTSTEDQSLYDILSTRVEAKLKKDQDEEETQEAETTEPVENHETTTEITPETTEEKQNTSKDVSVITVTTDPVERDAILKEWLGKEVSFSYQIKNGNTWKFRGTVEFGQNEEGNSEYYIHSKDDIDYFMTELIGFPGITIKLFTPKVDKVDKVDKTSEEPLVTKKTKDKKSVKSIDLKVEQYYKLEYKKGNQIIISVVKIASIDKENNLVTFTTKQNDIEIPDSAKLDSLKVIAQKASQAEYEKGIDVQYIPNVIIECQTPENE